jgi:hypothetical protein
MHTFVAIFVFLSHDREPNARKQYFIGIGNESEIFNGKIAENTLKSDAIKDSQRTKTVSNSSSLTSHNSI